MGSQDHPVGQLFWGFSKFQPPGAGVAPCPNMGTENLNFLQLLKTMIVGALWFRLGLLSIRILCFLNRIKITGLWPLRQGAKMRAASKNDPNLTITLPNFNIFQ